MSKILAYLRRKNVRKKQVWNDMINCWNEKKKKKTMKV